MKDITNYLTKYFPYKINVYFNSKFLYKSFDGYKTEKKIFRVTGINNNNNIKIDNISGFYNIKAFKLILRPLSEYNQIEEINERFSKYDKEQFENAFFIFGGCNNRLDFINYTQAQLMFKYHLDIFGLIDKGLAIDIKTLKKEIKTSNKINKSIKNVTGTMYNEIRRRSRDKGYIIPTYTLTEFREWLNLNNFNKIYNNWIKNKYVKDFKPSINRIDPYKGYDFNNIELMTWKENRETYYNNKLNGINNKTSKAVLQYDLNGDFIKEYYSIGKANRETNIDRSGISGCCNNRLKNAGGYIWKFK
jgi:hypothetical protein